jgi:hypothetical protein
VRLPCQYKLLLFLVPRICHYLAKQASRHVLTSLLPGSQRCSCLFNTSTSLPGHKTFPSCSRGSHINDSQGREATRDTANETDSKGRKAKQPKQQGIIWEMPPWVAEKQRTKKTTKKQDAPCRFEQQKPRFDGNHVTNS